MISTAPLGYNIAGARTDTGFRSRNLFPVEGDPVATTMQELGIDRWTVEERLALAEATRRLAACEADPDD
jgi:hypothetical protein